MCLGLGGSEGAESLQREGLGGSEGIKGSGSPVLRSGGSGEVEGPGSRGARRSGHGVRSCGDLGCSGGERVPDLWGWVALVRQKPQFGVLESGGSGQWSPRGIERSGPESQGSSGAVGGPGGLWWSRDPGPALLVGLTAGLGGSCGMEGGTGDTADPWRGEPGRAPVQSGLALTDSPCAPSPALLAAPCPPSPARRGSPR